MRKHRTSLHHLLGAVLAAALLLAGCSAAPSTMSMDAGAPAVQEATTSAYDASGGALFAARGEGLAAAADVVYSDDDLPGVAQGRKIIRSASFSIETRSFDASLSTIRESAQGIGGYFESSSIEGNASSGRHGRMTVRVPDTKMDDFLALLRGMETVTSESTQDSDVTEQYIDTQIRIDVLEASLKRLQELQDETEDIDSVILLQQEIQSTLYDLESLTSDLRALDARIDFATVSLSLREVMPDEITAGNKSLFDSISSAFIRSTNGVIAFLRGAVIVASALLPVLLLLGVAFAVFLVVFRLAAKRWPFRKKKKSAPPPEEKKNPSDGGFGACTSAHTM